MIPILGNSGSQIEVIRKDGSWVVKKTFPPAEAARMLSQVEKMRCETPQGFFFPRIISVDAESGSYLMQHVAGEDMVSLTSWSPPSVFLETIDRLRCFLTNVQVSAGVEAFPTAKWEEKMNRTLETIAVRCPILLEPALSAADRMRSLRPGAIPAGPCHGDFSLSNMLVTPRGICLLDPISSPIETPIEDAAKLLMDMDTAWSASRFVGSFDRSKVEIRWRRAASDLRQAIEKVCDADALEAMRGLCMIRVAPYSTDSASVEILKAGLKGVA